MKMFIVLSALVAITYAAPQSQYQQQLKNQSQSISPDDSFEFSYDAGNSITMREAGYLKPPGIEDGDAQVAQGSYSYTSNYSNLHR